MTQYNIDAITREAEDRVHMKRSLRARWIQFDELETTAGLRTALENAPFDNRFDM